MTIKINYTGVLLHCLLVFFSFSSEASEILVDFNSPHQLLDKFALFCNLEYAPPVQFEDSGVGNSGSVGRNRTHTGPTYALYKKSPLDLSGRDRTINTSAFFKFDEGSRGASIELVVFSNTNLTNSAHVRVGLRVDNIRKNAEIYSQCGFGEQGRGGPIFGSLPENAIEPDRWYKLSASFTFMHNGNVGMAVSVNDFGKDGRCFQKNTFDQAKGSFSLQQQLFPETYATILKATEAYVGFSLMGDWTAGMIDNFSIDF